MTAVNGIGLVVYLGERLFLVGPSGSGSITPVPTVIQWGINTRTAPTIYWAGSQKEPFLPQSDATFAPWRWLNMTF